MAEIRLPDMSPEEEPNGEKPFLLEDEPTQTIELGGLFTKDVTSSGSFDIRGGIWASTFGKLLQSLPIPAFLVDQFHLIMVANQACARIETSYERIQGRELERLFPNPSDAATVSEILDEIFRTRKPRAMQGMLQIGKGNIWARLTFRSIRIIDLRTVMVLVQDLTNEKKLMRLSRKYQDELKRRVEERTAELTDANVKLRKEVMERKRAEDLLVQSERLRAVGEMSAGVAHNLKNLIQILFGFTHATIRELERGDTAAASKELDNIVESLQHGAETVRRLQSFARVGKDDVSESGAVFDLSALTRQAVEFTTPFWETYPRTAGIKVNLKTDLLEGCFVKGYQGQLFEVLVNLIKNAAEALTEGGEICLSSTIEEGKILFRVTDSGVGIQEEHLSHLFTPFFSTKSDSGTGLGLATSRSIIATHGGDIAVQSSYGKGTTFCVQLPLAPSPVQPPACEELKTVPGGLTILAVDDMEATLMILRLGLEAYQHTVLTASSGEEALEIIKTRSVDLVICDLAMPGMNGWEVGRRIVGICQEKRIPAPPFVLLTAWAPESVDRTKMYESRVEAILEKPVDIKDLTEVIAKVIKRPSGASLPYLDGA
jgi:signal transduction histidine kinase/ActR/RegA family two-component response regulator